MFSFDLSVGHGFSSNNTYVTLGGTLTGVTASVGYGTKTGFTAGIGFGLGIGMPGVGTNLTSMGLNYTQSGGVSANFLGMSFSPEGVRFSPSVTLSHTLYFQRQSSTPVTNEASEEEIWYYLFKHEKENVGKNSITNSGHALIYDPVSGKIYEVNYLDGTPGAARGLKFMLTRDRTEPKARAYVWVLKDPGVKEAFWGFDGGRGNLDYFPVTVNNPAAARAFFDNDGAAFDYNWTSNNCKHYVYSGLVVGGSDVRLGGPFPGNWVNSPPMGTWKSAQEVGIIK
ncbi:MAG: hypothetical protein EPN85_01965 [Bacteroidetes bacterium]|nr:MAG: hypothetical protein EPN85_01965 [Bacteroidota bacterium]